MASKKCLVVHPKLSIIGKKGNQPLAKGEEISLDEDIAKRLIASGKVKLVLTKKQKEDLEAKELAAAEAAEKEAAEAAAKAAEEQE